jgi:hypothetical protein
MQPFIKVKVPLTPRPEKVPFSPSMLNGMPYFFASDSSVVSNGKLLASGVSENVKAIG